MTSKWRSTTCLLTCSVQMLALLLENDWLHLVTESLERSQKYSQDMNARVQSQKLLQIQIFQTCGGSPVTRPAKNVRKMSVLFLFRLNHLSGCQSKVGGGGGMAWMYGCIVWSWQKPNNPTSSGNTTCHCVRRATKGLASDRNAFCASQAA